jgi:IrrE N-terminal-like domain
MTDHGRRPIRWANDLNTLLAAVAAETGQPRFPVSVTDLALEISRSRFPDSPIIAVEGGSLGDFEGALYPVPDRKGWAILYNNEVSPGRRHFTIAHELGHYLMHRPLFPKGIQCSEESVTFRDGPELSEPEVLAASSSWSHRLSAAFSGARFQFAPAASQPKPSASEWPRVRLGRTGCDAARSACVPKPGVGQLHPIGPCCAIERTRSRGRALRARCARGMVEPQLR